MSILSSRFSSFAASILACALVVSTGSRSAQAGPPAPSPADTAAARAALQKYVAWAAAQPASTSNSFSMNMAASEPVQHYVSYSTASLTSQAIKVIEPGPGKIHLVRNTTVLAGTGTQYFSNRTWQTPPPPGGLFGTANPFDPSKQDSLGVSIDVPTATMTLTLKSWGNGQVVVPLFYANNVFYGFFSSPDGGMCVIDLKEVSFAIPK